MVNQQDWSSAKKPRLPRLRRAAPEEQPGLRLTERDMAIVKAVYSSRALTTAQIEALLFAPDHGQGHFTKTSRCQDRLKRLYHHGYLARAEQLQKASDGKKPFVYMLDVEGARLVAQLLGVDAGEVCWKPDDNLVSSPFLEHLLATNDVRVAVTLALRQHSWTMLEWRSEDLLKRPQMKDVVTITGPQGGQDRAAVVPDGYFRLSTSDEVYNFFLELDRSTVTAEAGQWGRRDWARKVLAYIEYYQSGRYQERYKTADLRIVTVTTGERRLSHLKGITEGVGGHSRFWFTTAGLATADNILTQPIWQVAGRDELFALIPPSSR